MSDYLLTEISEWVPVSRSAGEDFIQNNTVVRVEGNNYITYSVESVPIVRQGKGSSINDWEVFQFAGDLDLTNNQMNIVEDAGALRQAIQQGLLTDQGEFFNNLNYGLPYIDEILARKNSKGLLDSQILAFITSFPEVLEVLDYNSEITPQRKAQVSFVVLTSFGENLDLTVEFT